MDLPAVFVTGGNSGIGAAICKQLVLDKGCLVFLGSRSTEKGQIAIQDMRLADKEGNICVVQCDVNSDESVKVAAAKVKTSLGNQKLFGLVNNAGTGFSHKVTDEQAGRIVNMGSSGGPEFVSKISDVAVKKQMCSASTTWADLEVFVERFLAGDSFGGGTCYDLSKAGLMVYTMQLASQYPNVMVSCVNPGFIQTNMSKGYGATKKPEEGTVSTMRCLFDELPGNGLYYECDGLRSPLHVVRNPGAPEYHGEVPFYE